MRLRVLEPRDLRAEERHELEQRLPILGVKEARALLGDARSEVALLGLLVAEHLSDPAVARASEASRIATRYRASLVPQSESVSGWKS